MAEKEEKQGVAAKPEEEAARTQENDQKAKKEKGKEHGKELEALKKELAEKTEAADKAQKAVAELNDRYLRLMAEYDNFRKRTQREKEAIFPEATKTAVEAFVPVLDNLERALGMETADEEYKKGVMMICTAMLDAFKKLGVEEIAAKDQPFDPALHNAVMHIEDEAFPENTVCEVFAKGYKLGDLVIRHAMVKVAN